MAKTRRTRTRRTRTRHTRTRRQRGGAVNWNRYASNEQYRRNINAANRASYNAAIAQSRQYLQNAGVEPPVLAPVNVNTNVSNAEVEAALAELEAEIAAVNTTKNGRKFIKLTEEEILALNAENAAAHEAWLWKQIEE